VKTFARTATCLALLLGLTALAQQPAPHWL